MPTTIEYNGYVSISQQARIADFMSADDLRQRWSEGFEFLEPMTKIMDITQTGWEK